MRKISLSSFIIVVLVVSCNNVLPDKQNVEMEKVDVFVNSIKKLTNGDDSLYNTFNLKDFDFNGGEIVEIASIASNKNKEYVLFKNKNNTR